MAGGWRAAVLAAIGVVAAGCGGSGPVVTLDAIGEALPDRVDGWTGGEIDTYDTESIYSYINGHAEVYLAYGMEACLARRYEGPEGEPAIVVDVFEMGSSDDAYGVFTHDREGEAADVGEGAVVRHGWLSFWKGRFFVSVYPEVETDAAGDAVLAIGRAAAAAVPAAGTLPEIVERLPEEGLEARSVRFLRHHMVLNTHRFVSRDNVFGLGPRTGAALGRYERRDGAADLLVVDYPDAASAEEAMGVFAPAFVQGSADGRPVEVEDGTWWAARRDGARLAVVLGATSEDLAATLLAEAQGGDA